MAAEFLGIKIADARSFEEIIIPPEKQDEILNKLRQLL